MERNISEDNPVFEQEGSFEQQRPLVVQDILPPAGRKNLGQYYGHPCIRFLFENFLNIVQDRSQDGSVGGRQYDEIDTTAPLCPLHFNLGGLLGIGINQERSHFSRPASRVVHSADDGAI